METPPHSSVPATPRALEFFFLLAEALNPDLQLLPFLDSDPWAESPLSGWWKGIDGGREPWLSKALTLMAV